MNAALLRPTRFIPLAPYCLLALMLPLAALGQNAHSAPKDPHPPFVGEPANAVDGQAYLGYWTLESKLGPNTLKMGLQLDTADEDPSQLAGSLVSDFGEMHAQDFLANEDTLHFKLTSGLGEFQISVQVNDNEITGEFWEGSGAIEAAFTGIKSDRVSYERFLVPDNETRINRGDHRISLTFARPKADGESHAQLASLKPGQVVVMREDRVHKLMTDMNLRFGDLDVKTGNVAVRYPGVYGLWLKKTANGWDLVFNNKPDVWGTQYDPEADAGSVPLTVSKADSPSEHLVAKFTENDDKGELEIIWGETRFTTSFTIGDVGVP